ncbi:pyruvate kinase [Syntrophotalea acetylenivorans]|uniref:Pyruvate kinase n=1 Tax=Syntrophotalea acetylenivorans TaxID=1842532 RepID=A0A1L3GPX2_9BACT|nr:pyruvate kinase [Syntrophotalea acetylenivorans]
MPIVRHTKIIATVGPASQSEEQLLKLMEAGADIFRLNFSHGDHASKKLVIERIRRLSQQRQRAVAIIGDLQGPKIRIGNLVNDGIILADGQEIILSTRELVNDRQRIPVLFDGLAKEVEPGQPILLDDGLIELEVLDTTSNEVRCKVRSGGLLKSRKGVNLPETRLSLPAFTEQDRKDIAFAIGADLDYLALSFVRTSRDVQSLKSHLSSLGADLPIIAKIEKPQALADFTGILEVSDGIMVARGDLGVEIGPEQVPLIQKQIIRQCREAGKPVITATQMLESMVTQPRPTRAEASDVANAILDGSDAIMLSAETAVGQYPAEAVAFMNRMAQRVENDLTLHDTIFNFYPADSGSSSLSDAIGEAACRTATSIEATAILAFTQTGATAARVARYRPSKPIYAITPSRSVRRRLTLYAGVRSLQVDFQGDTEAQIRSLEKAVLEAGVLKRGDLVIITMGSPLAAHGTTNLMKVHRLGSSSHEPAD